MQITGRPPAAGPSGSVRPLRTADHRAALHHLLEHGSLTRVELHGLTGLSEPTTSQVMDRLLESGLAVTAGRTASRRFGSRAEAYRVNADYAYAGAATLREPHGLTVAVADLAGRERASAAKRVDFRAVAADRAVLDLLTRTAAAAGIDPDRIGSLHLAVPGAYDPDTDTIGHTDLPGLAGMRPRSALSERFSAAIEIHNDVNTATMAERRNPHASGGLAVLWLGSEGIGVGIDLGRGPLIGERGAAGELGYAPAFPDRSGPDDPTFQDWLGAPAIAELGGAHGIEGGNAVAITAAAVARGSEAFLVDFAERIAAAVCLLCRLIDPPRVVLAGEVAAAGREALLAHVRAAAGHFGERVLPSAIDGDAVAIGALDSAYAVLKARVLDSATAVGRGRVARR